MGKICKTFEEKQALDGVDFQAFPGEVHALIGENGVRFLLISGTPIKEPVAWHGPIVMNSQEELRQAFNELNNGTFIK